MIRPKCMSLRWDESRKASIPSCWSPTFGLQILQQRVIRRRIFNGMVDVKEVAGHGVTYGNGQISGVGQVGNLRVKLHTSDGQVECGGKIAVLTEVSYVSNSVLSLFNVNGCTYYQGWKMMSNKTGLWLTKGDFTIKFDIPILTKKCVIWAKCMSRVDATDEMAAITIHKPLVKRLSIKVAHKLLGHANEDVI